MSRRLTLWITAALALNTVLGCNSKTAEKPSGVPALTAPPSNVSSNKYDDSLFPTAAQQTTFPKSEEIKGPIANFRLVSVDGNGKPAIFRGGNPIDKSKKDKGNYTNVIDLKNHGVKTDIDLQGGDGEVAFGKLSKVVQAVVKQAELGERREEIAQENQSFAAAGLSFLSFPINSLQPVLDDTLKGEIPNILEAMHNSANWPVYVHCEHGHDRTGMIIALYRVIYEHVPVLDAYQEMIQMGHNPDDHATESMDIAFFKLTSGRR